MTRFPIICCALLLSGIAQAQPAGTDLDLGRQLTAQLKLDQASDAALFQVVGPDRVSALLLAVMAQGRSSGATAADWQNLHRATTGLIELFVSRNQLVQAAGFAGLQNQFYDQLEHDYPAALAAAREALDLQQRSGATGTLFLAHNAVGRDLMKMGQPEAALAAFHLARQTDPGALHPASAAAWRDLIEAEISLIQLSEARRDVADLLRTARQAPPEYRAQALLARADIEIADGRYSAAIDTIEEAKPLVSDPVNKLAFEAEALNVLMSCYLEALRGLPYNQAVPLAEKLGRSSPNLGIDLAGLARSFIVVRRRLAGDLEGALRDDNQRLEAARANSDLHAQVEILRSIAVTYGVMHARAQQIEVLREALADETLTLPPGGIPDGYPAAYSYFVTLNRLGDAYADAGDPQGEVEYAQVLKTFSSIAAAGEKKQLEPLASEARLGQAQIAVLSEEPDRARSLFAAEMKSRPTDPWVALQWARLERSPEGHPAKAGELYAAAVDFFHSQADLQDEVSFRLEYARFLATEGLTRVPDALSLAHRQVDLVQAAAEGVASADSQWQLLYTRGLVAEAETKRDDAIQAYRQAVDRLELMRAGVAQESHRQALAGSRLSQELYAHLVALLTGADRPAQVWEYVERGKARAFLEMLHGRRFNTDSVASPDFAPLHDLQDRIAALNADLHPVNQALLRSAGREPVAIRAQIGALELRYEILRDLTNASSASARAGETAVPLSLSETAALLPPDTALLEYSILDKSIAAFVVTGQGSKLRSWPVNPLGLTIQINHLRNELKSPDSEPDASIAALSKLLIDPIAADIPAGVKHLLIVPSAELYELPFQILRTSEGPALVDRFVIGYLPSADSLRFLDKRGSQDKTLFLGALGNVSVEGMVPLPGTLVETAAIQKIDPRARSATEAAFTHDTARDALLHFGEVHFATHGILDRQSPLFSALITSPAPGQPNRFSLYELTGMKLRAHLVILSACETGLGALSGGDEVAGLNRSFLAAGAGVVVSSLWSVSDESTALLMLQFHSGLRDGLAAAAALRQAQLAVRKVYPHPYYWAPFVLTGVE